MISAIISRSAVLLLLLTMPTAAFSQWLDGGEDIWVDGQKPNIAMAFDRDYALAFRCDADGVSSMYLVPVVLDNTDIDRSVRLVTLHILVDDLEVLKKSAVVDRPARRLLVKATANADRTLLEQIRRAKHSVSVAVLLNEQKFYDHTFSALGSADTIEKFMATCRSLGS